MLYCIVSYCIALSCNLKRIKRKSSSFHGVVRNVNHLVHTVDYDLTSIGALNTDDSEVIESMEPHCVTKVSRKPESAERTFR